MPDFDPLAVLLGELEAIAQGADPELAGAVRTVRKGRPSDPLRADPRPVAWSFILRRVVGIVQAYYGLHPRDLPCPDCGRLGLTCPVCNVRKGRPRTYTEAHRAQARASIALARAARQAKRQARKGQAERDDADDPAP